MKISAKVQNSAGQHHITLRTNEDVHSLAIPPKPTGFGSSANGGELLFLALATCYCNDIYREAAKRGLKVEQIEVEVEGARPTGWQRYKIHFGKGHQ
ncbi:MAG: OsmC family peroxiredoxin [Proteobacteria bacterium]|nr:OsmC family peroxiredoxin [Pseudomonadota bacterium]